MSRYVVHMHVVIMHNKRAEGRRSTQCVGVSCVQKIYNADIAQVVYKCLVGLRAVLVLHRCAVLPCTR